MPNIFLRFLSALFLTLWTAFLVADDWKMENGKLWSRDAKAAVLSKEDATNVLKVVHTGEQDWAISEGKPFPVKPGDAFELNIDAVLQGTGNAGISVVTRDKDGQAVAWSYANKGFKRTEPSGDTSSLATQTSRFGVPRGIVSIEPRIVGSGPSTVRAANFSMRKLPGMNFGPPGAPFVKENKFLKVVFVDNSFSVTDKRTGRTWSGTADYGMGLRDATPRNRGFSIHQLETLRSYTVFVTIEPDSPEFTVEIEHTGPMDGSLTFPAPLTSNPGDRLIVPMNEGISYPVEEKDIKVGRLVAYGGHGICMAFWGQIEDATGAGMAAILETPDDAAIDIRPGKNDLLRINASWDPSMKEFRYPRKIRYVFFDKGGHVAVCKRYRQHAKATGLLVPFAEKAKRIPNIDKLLGAANIWYMDGDKIELAKEMKSLGIDRILWSSGGGAKHLAELNQMKNVLTSRYDIYQDIMDPARFDEVGKHPDWTTEAWPHDINWAAPDGTWRKGWEVTPKDKTKPRIPCAVICDAKAVPYARDRITKELKEKPYTCRFIDTTVAAPWFECYHPDHPMTRSDSRKHKMELLKLIGDLGLVCGSETGHDASVPFCEYYEGMLSLGPYRVPDSGRDMLRIWDEVPPVIERFQVNEKLRLPLWELVYHDCVVAQWYWGDYNNKLPKVWRKRDLFNALYGTPPMYLFNRKGWNENKEKFAESYKTAEPVSRATAYAEMVDHRILSPDRTVQQSVFSNGVTVTVNFGDKPFKLPDGTTLNGDDWKMSNK